MTNIISGNKMDLDEPHNLIGALLILSGVFCL
jgi:hypothetical protein